MPDKLIRTPELFLILNLIHICEKSKFIKIKILIFNFGIDFGF